MSVPIYTISLPQYQVDTEPDDEAIGATIDAEIKEHFLGKYILIRGVASSEHPDKTLDQLVEVITTTGTDRYDPDRAGDRYENIEGKHIDLFAFSETVEAATKLTQPLIWGFYHSALGIHGKPMRIDIITIYDAEQMNQITHQYEGRDDVKDDGFAFKYPENKLAAVKTVFILT